MWGILTALLSGALMSIQGVFNTDLTKQTSLWVSASFVQFTALFACLIAWQICDRTSFRSILEVSDKYILLGGIIGAFITATVILGTKSLGPARAAMLIVIAQITIAWLIELAGVFGMEKQEFSMRKLIGLLIAAAGVITFEL